MRLSFPLAAFVDRPRTSIYIIVKKLWTPRCTFGLFETVYHLYRYTKLGFAGNTEPQFIIPSSKCVNITFAVYVYGMYHEYVIFVRFVTSSILASQCVCLKRLSHCCIRPIFSFLLNYCLISDCSMPFLWCMCACMHMWGVCEGVGVLVVGHCVCV